MRPHIALFAALLIGMLASITCQQSTSPNKNPEIIPHSTLPRPFSNSTYFLYGEKLSNGEQPILDSLESKGFQLRDAWVPDSFAACMGSIIRSEMVVQLKQPDSSIYSLGFTSDSTQFSDYCIVTWKDYHF
jgi:hypothetical protein